MLSGGKLKSYESCDELGHTDVCGVVAGDVGCLAGADGVESLVCSEVVIGVKHVGYENANALVESVNCRRSICQAHADLAGGVLVDVKILLGGSVEAVESVAALDQIGRATRRERG